MADPSPNPRARRLLVLKGGIYALLGVGVVGTSWQAMRASRSAAELSRQLQASAAATRLAREAEATARAAEGAARGEADAARLAEQAARAQVLAERDALAASHTSERMAREAEAALRAQRDKAQHRFDDAHKLARVFLLDVSQALKNLPGAADARAIVIHTSTEYLDRLAPETTAEPALQRDVAEAYLKVGDVQAGPPANALPGEQAGDRTGEATAALTSFEKAATIFGRLLTADPSDGSARRGLVLAHQRAGDALAVAGRGGEALGHFAQAADLASRYGRDEGDDPFWKLQQVAACRAAGRALLAANRPADASVSFRDALDAAAALAATGTSAAESADVAALYRDVGDAQAALHNDRDALGSYEKAVEAAKSRAEADPSNADAARDWAESTACAGDYYAAKQNFGDAIKKYEAAAAIRRRLADADPGEWRDQYELGRTYAKVGGAQRSGGQQAAALASYRSRLEVAARLAEAMPRNLFLRHDLLAAYAEVAKAYESAGNLAEAVAHYQKAIDVGKALAEANANVVAEARAGRRELLDLCRRCGDAEATLSDSAAALASYREASKLAEQLAATAGAQGGTDLAAKREVAECLRNVGTMERATGDNARAVTTLTKAAAVRKELADADQGRPASLRPLLDSWVDLAEAQAALGSAEAVASYRHAADACHALAAATGTDPAAQRDCARLYYRVGRACALLGANEQWAGAQRAAAWTLAREAYAGSLRLLQRLAGGNTSDPSEAAMPDVLRGRIAECDQALASLSPALEANRGGAR